MGASGTEIGGARHTFGSTLWTVVLRAKNPKAPERRQALETLIHTYWKPIYFFIRTRGTDSETAKDFTQGFFTTLLERDFLKNVAPERGRFRSFLLAAVQNYLSDERERGAAQKRGGGMPPLSLDFARAESEVSRIPPSRQTPDQLFRRQWAIQVMSQALQLLKHDFQEGGREAEFDALREHLVPGSADPRSYSAIAKGLGVGEQDVANLIHRTRARYRQAILEAIHSYTDTEEDARAEVQDLFSAFSWEK